MLRLRGEPDLRHGVSQGIQAEKVPGVHEEDDYSLTCGVFWPRHISVLVSIVLVTDTDIKLHRLEKINVPNSKLRNRTPKILAFNSGERLGEYCDFLTFMYGS